MNPTIKSTIYDLLTSKKALATAAAIILYVTGRWGIHVDPAALDRVFAAILVYVGAQGVADIGKPAAIVAAKADAEPVGPPMSKGFPRSPPPGITGSLVAVLVLGLVAAPLSACNPTSPLHPVVECTLADQGKIAALVAQLLPLLQGGTPDWATLERDAIAAGETIGGCALAQVIQGYLGPKAGVRAPDPLSGQLARATLEDFRARYAGGATFRTQAGDL